MREGGVFLVFARLKLLRFVAGDLIPLGGGINLEGFFSTSMALARVRASSSLAAESAMSFCFDATSLGTA